jgi:hypothetical protein
LRNQDDKRIVTSGFVVPFQGKWSSVFLATVLHRRTLRADLQRSVVLNSSPPLPEYYTSYKRAKALFLLYARLHSNNNDSISQAEPNQSIQSINAYSIPAVLAVAARPSLPKPQLYLKSVAFL